MSKPTYQPLKAHLLKSKVGDHYSMIVLLPGGHFLQAAVFPGIDEKILSAFDLEENLAGAPVYETEVVISLTPKAAPAEKL